jgi:hypothetical protein
MQEPCALAQRIVEMVVELNLGDLVEQRQFMPTIGLE